MTTRRTATGKVQDIVDTAKLDVKVSTISDNVRRNEEQLNEIIKEHWKLFNDHKLGKQEMVQYLKEVSDRITILTQLQNTETNSAVENLRHIDRHYKQLLVKTAILSQIEQDLIKAKAAIEILTNREIACSHKLDVLEINSKNDIGKTATQLETEREKCRADKAEFERKLSLVESARDSDRTVFNTRLIEINATFEQKLAALEARHEKDKSIIKELQSISDAKIADLEKLKWGLRGVWIVLSVIGTIAGICKLFL